MMMIKLLIKNVFGVVKIIIRIISKEGGKYSNKVLKVFNGIL